MKLPFMKFYPNDWLRDTRKLSPTARGVWIDICAYCWNEPERGVYRRTKIAMRYEHSLDKEQLEDVLYELQTVADVGDNGDNVVIVSRRIYKEETNRKYERDRKRAQRCPDNVPENSEARPGSVTPKTLDVRRQTSEEEKEKNIKKEKENAATSGGDNGLPRKPERHTKKPVQVPYWKELIAHVNAAWLARKKAPYPWSPYEYAQLSHLARIYGASSVMAMWDLYMQSETYWGKQTRYMIEGLKRDVGVIVDDLRWKTLCKTYEEKLAASNGETIVSTKELVTSLGLGAKSIP